MKKSKEIEYLNKCERNLSDLFLVGISSIYRRKKNLWERIAFTNNVSKSVFKHLFPENRWMTLPRFIERMKTHLMNQNKIFQDILKGILIFNQ